MGSIFRPVVQAHVPDGWFAKESLTLLEPGGKANVIASSEPLDVSIDSFRYAQVQGDLLEREFNGYVEHEFVPEVILGGRPGYYREFSWTPPDGAPVRQIQLYFAERGRGYTATATTTEEEFGRFADALRRCLLELTIAAVDDEAATHHPINTKG